MKPIENHHCICLRSSTSIAFSVHIWKILMFLNYSCIRARLEHWKPRRKPRRKPRQVYIYSKEECTNMLKKDDLKSRQQAFHKTSRNRFVFWKEFTDIMFLKKRLFKSWLISVLLNDHKQTKVFIYIRNKSGAIGTHRHLPKTGHAHRNQKAHTKDRSLKNQFCLWCLYARICINRGFNLQH